MPIVELKGYHSCRTKGGAGRLNDEAPFLSGDGSNQWLTQGYYFWTDSVYWAHKWGKDSVTGNYAILECDISIDDKYYLDLVGCVDSQLWFNDFLDEIYEIIDLGSKRAEHLSLNTIINFARNMTKDHRSFFPFKAIKVSDTPKSSERQLRFIDGKSIKRSFAPTRQQLCLFEQARDCITNKVIIHPEGFR